MKRKTSKKKPVPTGIPPDRKAGGRDNRDGKEKHEDVPADPFDFGGFPARDLKKNLGCG